MAAEEVLYTWEDGVGVITLNRPEKLNALTPGIRDGMLRYVKEADEDPEIRAVVLTGNGRGFCSGGDVPNFPTGEEGKAARVARANEPPRPLQETNYAYNMRNSKKLIVGAINGYAVGAGFGLALACDIRIAAEGARFAVFQVRRGIQPDGGLTYLLPRTVGTQKAFELAVRGAKGEFVEAEEALQLGLVAKVVPLEALMDEAMDLARSIAKGPPIAFGLAKRGFYRGMEWTFEEGARSESEGVGVCFATEDAEEGVRAFVERREPVFVGR